MQTSPPSRRAIHVPKPEDARAALVVSALGIVFGDLGTSPLYTLQECLGAHGVPPDDANILGVLSLVFWSLTMVVTVKYLLFLMRADNHGEGGIMALLALVPERLRSPGPGRIGIVALLVIVGAALLFGDGIITPAISVLSAVEGLKGSPLEPTILPVTILILVGLFAVQSRGTAKLGTLFGPVMLLWFLTLAALGAWHIAHEPAILVALSPLHAALFFVRHHLGGVLILGGVVLCVTGGEALYADMGHFGASPIRKAWLLICLPSLVLSYFGQGAVLLSLGEKARADAAAQPFYSMCPDKPWLYVFVVLGALATVIASQALISGVFSLTYQAIQLGFFPRLSIRHTSDEAEGQIYLPLMNWGLAVACVALVLSFKESSRLAAAFGLAVSGTMAITSVIYYVVLRHTWHWSLPKALGLLLLFLSFDVPFVVANAFKFLDGGYVPFCVGVFFVVVMVIWRLGRGHLTQHLADRTEPLPDFAAALEERVQARVPGTAVYLASVEGVPPALRRAISRFRVMHESVVVLSVLFDHVPTVPDAERLSIGAPLGKGLHRMTLRYGFIEQMDVHEDVMRALPKLGVDAPPASILYVLGRETFVGSSKGNMGMVTERIFAFLSRNAKTATDHFHLPHEQVLEIGAQVDL